ncbi:MAG TPA: HEPN domain-containing protein [Nitrospiraceae bacterium]|nr:HEPN domain-containing protein [Nitrospiraceae bacterium]
MSRAHEAFAEGDYLLTKDSLTGAVNRFYYGGFYTARALLATKEVDSSRHSGVISLFQKHFVTTGQVSPAHAKALPRSLEKRQNTDYADFATIAPEEARSVREDIRAFVDECAELLERLLTSE